MGRYLGGLVILAAASGLWADELTEQVAAQKKTAAENCKKLEIDKPAERETANVLLYGTVPKAKLKTIGDVLEKQLAHARKALAFGDKDRPWPGKLTAYVFAERGQFTSFVRSIEKRRAEPDDLGSFSLGGTEPHIAAGPATDKDGPSAEAQIGTQLGGILLKKKADRAAVPSWLIEAFGRATVFMTTTGGYSASKERAAARALAAKIKSVKEIWDGSLKDEDARVLATSLIYYVAYGPAAGRLPGLIAGFNLEENQTTKSVEEALSSAKINLDMLDQRWQAWIRAK